MTREGMLGFPGRKVFSNQKGGRMKNKQELQKIEGC